MRLEDLPDKGWTPDSDADPEGTDQKSSRPHCDAKAAPFLKQQPSGTALTGFSTVHPDGIESVSARVLVYPTGSEADAAMKSARRLAASCTEWTNGGLDGKAFLASEQLVDRRIADDAFLVRGQLAAVGFDEVRPTHYMWVMARQGDSAALLYAVWPNGLDRGVVGPTELQQYAQKILDRSQ